MLTPLGAVITHNHKCNATPKTTSLHLFCCTLNLQQKRRDNKYKNFFNEKKRKDCGNWRYPHWTFTAAFMQPFWHARSGQIRSSRPLDKGARSLKKFFSSLRASVQFGLKIRGWGCPPGPLPGSATEDKREKGKG